ncbi:hypothetical protein CBS101457_002100 [Exobasidium rhododendri]|nr:hypothetical protein CBS101457_002100 [Exobasidium rhododendri]
MSQSLTWHQRYTQLETLIESPLVAQVRQEALKAARFIPQTDENAASAAASHQVSLGIVDSTSKEEILGRQLDTSLAILWSTPFPSTVDANAIRHGAQTALKSLLNVSLSESSRDLSSITCLESNREGTVELVRCRLDRKIYVLKSTTKGAAKRGYRSNAPVTERRLLTLSRRCREENLGKTTYTPTCVAAFQSPGSLHILMDYCPAGDLYHFLESAGEAPTSNEARNKSGGLLAERYVKRYAVDMVAAIAWIHEQGFMHRDIKPGNWLFDKTGHLLLCDLASAAPFTYFDLVPSSGNLPEADSSRVSKVRQRRVLNRHCCLIGTADYIAPEIFCAADLMSRKKERKVQREERGDASTSLLSVEYSRSTDDVDEGEEEDDDEPPPDGPGLYGPECDWWSLGVVLFEMVYKRMPFFSEKIAETMEMIKDHETYFRLDSWVRCSGDLQDLIRRLISQYEKRIGFTSSAEVKAHPLFRGVDWDDPWQGEPVPFVPNLDAAVGQGCNSFGETSMWQQEPSILHSPQWKGNRSNSTHLSRMWTGDPKDFPAFPNSVEYSRSMKVEAIQEEAGSHGDEQDEQDEADEDDSGVTVTYSSPSTRRALERKQPTSKTMEIEKLWSKFDPTWIGFSYVPGQKMFEPVAEVVRAVLERMPSPISSPDSVTAGTFLDSPQASFARLPMVSTPCKEYDSSIAPTPPPVQSTPFHPSVAHNLRRRAMETASRVRSETVEHEIYRGFATPLRKTSMPNMASQDDRQQMMSNLLQTPANPPSSSSRHNVPASPYPFPVATVARPRKTPAAAPARLPSSILERKDAERARSSSSGTGEGSDSRCSGGSNIKRDISEREAWKELQLAVVQSARKGRTEFVKELEERKMKKTLMMKKDNVPTSITTAKRRPLLPLAATDSVLDAVQTHSTEGRRGEGPIELPKKAPPSTSSTSAFGLGALSGAFQGKRPNLTRFLSQNSETRVEKPTQGVGKVSPKRAPSIASVSPASSVSSSSSSSSSPPPEWNNKEKGVPSSTSQNRLVLPSFWNRHDERAKLNKKKSARQLLLKAQDLATPTKIASRSGSPLLTSFQNLSLTSESSNADIDVPSSRNRQESSFDRKSKSNSNGNGNGNINGNLEVIGLTANANRSTTSLHSSADNSSDYDQRYSSPPKSALIAQLKRDDMTSRQRMRRQDSTEMLSQYRKGINPDQTLESVDPTLTTNQSVNVNQTVSKRGPRRVRSIQILQPKISNRNLTGLRGGGEEEVFSAVSSPSIPSFPDAFGGDVESEKHNYQGMRRASMFPLRSKESEDIMEVLQGTGTTQFRSLQSRRNSGRPLGKKGSRLTIMTDRGGGGCVEDVERLSGSLSAQRPHSAGARQTLFGGEGDSMDGPGNVSVLSGLDWRYESMRDNLTSVEERLERLKARLHGD